MKKNFIKVLIGILLVVFGFSYILSNIGVIPIGITELVRNFWPAVIILCGLYWIVVTLMSHLTRKGKFQRIYWACSIILLSLIILENRLHLVFKNPISIWEILLAVLLIFIGVHILFFNANGAIIEINRNVKFREKASKNDKDDKDEKCETSDCDEPCDDSDYTEKNHQSQNRRHSRHTKSGIHIGQDHFVGEIRLGKTPWVLEDSSYRVSVGDIDVDLSTAFLPDGTTTLELNGWVGDIEIKMPEDMAVDLTANVNIGTIDLFGDETKFAKGKSGNTHFTSNTVSYRSDQYDSANKKVKIKASVNIGEISIERV